MIKSIRPSFPNKGLELAYRRKLKRLIAEMQKSVLYWLKARYTENESEILAFDASPAKEMTREVKKRTAQWKKKFNKIASRTAKKFVQDVSDYSSLSLKKSFEASGFTVSFQETPALKNAMDSFINENVNLIKSIPEKYFTEVEGLVMRSVRDGRDLAYLTEELKSRYDITNRRAVLIARDQNNKATETINRIKVQELGVKKAIWYHTGGVKEPRHSHVLANGKEFDLNEGCLIDGEYIYPAEKINCKCTFKPIIEGFE